MIDNDNDGERELVLGNKQLLGIFFVATLLCGVFFAMGYVVGGNSAKSAVAASIATDTASSTTEGQRDEPLSPKTPATGADTASNPVGSDSGSQLPGPDPTVSDNPAAAASAPVQAPPAATKSAPDAAPAPETAVYVSVPENGARYWQVIATQRPAADTLVQSLRDRHLPAILAASSAPKLFEVLVGPYRSDITLADAKKKLTEIGGFDGLIPRKF